MYFAFVFLVAAENPKRYKSLFRTHPPALSSPFLVVTQKSWGAAEPEHTALQF